MLCEYLHKIKDIETNFENQTTTNLEKLAKKFNKSKFILNLNQNIY